MASKSSTRPAYEEIELPAWPDALAVAHAQDVFVEEQHDEQHEDQQVLTDRQVQSALPPTDQGYRAWMTLGCSFLSNVLIWGFALSFGVLQEYLTSHEPFASQGGVAAVGTTSTGFMFVTMPLYLWLFQRYPRWRQYSLYVSLPIVAAAFIGASFATKVWQLLLCQGIVYAIGGNSLVMPNINYINEWFARKRGLAIGISIAGDSTGGVIMPLILQALLSKVGFGWTMRIVAAIIIIPAAPIPFIAGPRLPISASHVAPPVNTSFLRSPLFWILQLFNMVQALGYFLPTNYLPTIAEALGLSSTLGSLTVLFVNFAGVFGCIGVGALVDRFDVTAVLLGVSIIAGCAVFAILGVTTSIAPLFVFSILYGLSAGGYSTGWAGMIKAVQSKHEGTDANMVFGLLAAGRGVGSIVSGPLSESLLQRAKGFSTEMSSVYGSEFGNVIIFVGTTAIAGGFGWFVRRSGLI